jgi:hypothetical protein
VRLIRINIEACVCHHVGNVSLEGFPCLYRQRENPLSRLHDGHR